MTIFRLDRMTGDVRKLTLTVLSLTGAVMLLANAGPPAMRPQIEIVAAVLAGVCALTWLTLRPTRFIVDETSLRIEWPIRVRLIPRAAIAGARLVKAADFRRAHKLRVRIGAGGLWGTFGLLKGARETYSTWVSRTDRWVVVHLTDGGLPLLLTPAHPEKFVAELGALPANVVDLPV
ncbi:MAG TPA: PH domain-containing protein [Polyangia bacterium]|nr:PH domain-containing protein [Polyangia bacterium]